jgi:hypothetical protein
MLTIIYSAAIPPRSRVDKIANHPLRALARITPATTRDDATLTIIYSAAIPLRSRVDKIANHPLRALAGITPVATATAHACVKLIQFNLCRAVSR